MKISPPSGVRIKQTEDGLKIRCHWFSMWALGDSMAAIFIAAVLIRLGWPFRQMFATEHFTVFAGAAGVTAYFCIARMVNASKLQLSADEIRISHGPLPWLPARSFATRDLSDLRVRESAHHYRRLGTVNRYQVLAVLKNGRHLKLISGLYQADRAYYVKQVVEQFVG